MTIASVYQKDIADYWNAERSPVNLRLGDVSGIYHHHYGIGDVDRSVLDVADGGSHDEAVIAELHRLENAQAQLLLSQLGDIRPEHRLLDAGSGRGGTSIMANNAFGCRVDGVSISQSQVDFANGQAAKHRVDDRVRFHLKNMLDTGFEAGAFQAIWNNESTMYVVLDDLFAAHSRLLARGGKYVTITGCYNDV